MKSERNILLYIICILFILLAVSGFGLLNYKNKSFEGLPLGSKLNPNTHIKYANLNWLVVNDSNTYVTLILAENAKLGAYGTSTSFKNSDISDYLNNEWIKEDSQKDLAIELDHGALVYDSDAKSYIRLLKYSECENNPIKNDSTTPYWLMSNKDNKVFYALSNGYTSYTSYDENDTTNSKCYKGSNKASLNDLVVYSKVMNLKQVDTLSDSFESSVVTNVTAIQETDTCYSSYTLDHALFSASGDESEYVNVLKLDETKEAVGIRPVIKVKKK